jgi:hypothetical protein
MNGARYTGLMAALLSLASSGCATTALPEFADWSTITDGCRSHGLSEVMLFPDDLGMELHPTDIRIGRLPDTGKGPGLLVHFRQGRNGIFAQATEPPRIFIAVGDWNHSCSIQIDHAACPSAAALYQDLAKRSIPLGHAFDDPMVPTVMHGTTYFLSARDGHGNQTNWSYLGISHPLQATLDVALDTLAQCATPAANAFNEKYPERVP